ncbi:hypothetical protein [Clostridium sp. VAP41]|uniref:coiled-coil domain-containing protein n=1 Tax=Clostridium sp. VAP41 TaxID=2949979 RepID=UPI002079FA44|nr:hypothetical protein [Clostridium sp. VAP41]
MDITKFIEKFNRIDGNIYTIEEVVTPVDSVYEAELIHDNVNIKTINIYTGSKLTGTKITTYSTSTPSLTPWKTVIKIFSNISPLYISYETTGDQVEAEDINNLQDAVNITQEELNKETNRATTRENNIEKDLNSEITRAKNAESTENTRATNAEKLLTDNLNTEINRSKSAEKTLTENLNSEINRAKSVESDITSKLNEEVNRAKTKENSIESNLNNYKTSNDSEIQGLKAKDIDLDNKKANLDYVNLELNKRYTKDQTFTRDEVLKKIQDLIGTAPDTLDTFKEIADALGNDPNFAATIMNALAGKVDKVNGKELSTNDYDNTEKSKLSDVNAKKHEHSNKSIIDKITQGLLDAWNNAYSHISDSIRHITSSERNLWNTVSDKANKIDIPNKLSQLTNDKKFITQDDIDTSQNHIHNNKSVLDKISQETLDDINLSADKVLKNKLTPIEINSTLTKLDNCTGGYVRNMLLRGKTLQNLVSNPRSNNSTNVPTINKDEVSFNYDNNYTNMVQYDGYNILKINTNYTLIINILENTLEGADMPVKVVFDLYGEQATNIFKGVTGIQKRKFSINKNSNKIGLDLRPTTSGKFKYNSLMILEGDWTNKEIPEYFEGIQSTGELEGNKISILTKGKNFVNVINVKDNGSLVKVNEKTKNRVILEQVENNRKYAQTSINIHFKANTKYTLSAKIINKNTCLRVYNLDKDDSYAVLTETGSKTFTTRNDTNLQLLFYTSYEATENSGKIAEFENIQIEEGTIATQYEDYKDDETEILTGTEPLMFNDTIDIDNNKLIRETQKIILKDIKNVILYNTGSKNTLLFSISDYDNILGECTNKEVCDSFIVDNDYIWSTDKDSIQFISRSSSNGGKIRIRLTKTKLSGYSDALTDSQKIVLFKNYININPVTVYCSKTSVVEKLSIKDTLQTFTDGYIQLDNAITPVTQLEYSTNLPSVLSGVVEIQDKLIDRVNILEKKKSITWDELEGV